MSEIDDMEEDVDIAGVMPIVTDEPSCHVCNGRGIIDWIESEPESGITTLERATCDMCGGTGKLHASKEGKAE